MHYRRFYLLSSAIALAAIWAFHSEQSPDRKSEKPNILIILCDDLGYNDVGFNGSKDIPTPALDKLAKNGTIFSSAYVAHPFCGPSRTSLMTGRYAHKIGAQFNLPPNSETIGEGVPLSETFISTVLQKSGYKTGIIGKWHLGAIPKYHPNNRGFDEFYGFLGGGHNYHPEQFKAAYKKQKEKGEKVIFEYLLPLENNEKEVDETEYLTDAFSREAVRFVNKTTQKKDAFFLYLSYNAPHTPLEGKKEDLEKFMHIKDEKRRNYAAMVYAVDRGVDQITKALEANGQLENTLIIFLSDNGGRTDAGANNFPLRESKGSTCEGGYRVPMFFHWPGKVPAGETFNFPVSTLDFYPTFAALAKANVPKGKLLDGKNIWEDFLHKTNSHENQNIYVLRHREGYTDVGIRNNEWKALKTNQNNWKLYNLNKDIGENQDLSHENPELLKSMVKEGEKWSRSHSQPRWFHDEQTGIEWLTAQMPHFDQTFRID